MQGKAKLGVQAFADALSVIPKTLAENSGFDVLDTMCSLEEANSLDLPVGLDVDTGEAMIPSQNGIWYVRCVCWACSVCVCVCVFVGVSYACPHVDERWHEFTMLLRLCTVSSCTS